MGRAGAGHRGRAAALCMLYQEELSGDEADRVLELFRERFADESLAEESHRFAERLFRGVLRQRARIDALISGGSAHWRIERMAVVDRNVLRMAVFEMLDDPSTPPVVVIDEAIEVAKKYGSEESGNFINGVLDAILRRMEQDSARPEPGGKA